MKRAASKRLRICFIAICGCLIWIAGLAASAGATTVTYALIDSASGESLPARCRVIDAYGNNRYPQAANAFYHTACGGYFYTDGVFSIPLPAGRAILMSAHGFEYRERIDTFSVNADTVIVVPLARAISPADQGWFSGDAHVHINHGGGHYVLTPAHACLMGSAEGLSTVNCLDNDYCFTGAPMQCSASDCVVFMSEEWRSSSYGHIGFLGQNVLVEPRSSIWWPLAMDAVDSCRAHGGIAVSAHPITTDDFDEVETWAGSGLARELPIDIISERIDAIDVMSYSNLLSNGIELDFWYRLLNCGFRLPASAGTDAAMNRIESPPLGGYRLYVKLGGGVFDYGAWLKGLAAGSSFITNGPLITDFTVDGVAPGGNESMTHLGETVFGSISVRSVHPFDRIEIVVNGTPAISMALSPARCSVDTSFSLTILESVWIAARVTGPVAGWSTVGPTLFAHTNPIYMNVWGRSVVVPEAAQSFVEWIDSLVALAQEKGSWRTPGAEQRLYAECAAARAFYEDLALGAAAGTVEEPRRLPLASRVTIGPNPFSGETTIEIEVPGSGGTFRTREGGGAGFETTVTVYDVAGRLVRRLASGRREPGRHRIEWDGRDDRGAELASGVYFARIAVNGTPCFRKVVLVR